MVDPHAEAGRHWSEIETPAVLLDLDAVRRNIAQMADRAREMPVAVRPHFKAHRCIELARLQIEAGAVGLTVATAVEALALVDAGLDQVLIANEIVQPRQLEQLAQAASRAPICLLVDDPSNLRKIAEASRAAGSEIGVMVDVDIGMERCGVVRREDARGLAQLACKLDGIRFEGISAYEGHCTDIEDHSERAARTGEAIDELAGFADEIRASGIDVDIVSAAGTSTYEITGSDPRVTEIQPGAYVYMDLIRSSLLTDFEQALTVAGSVISRQGTRAVLDCGHRAVNARHGLPQLAHIPGRVLFIDEEHLRIDTPVDEPEIGNSVRVVPSYGPLTINLFDRLHVISDEIVIDEWSVVARR